MSARLEVFLARLYVEAAAREAYRADPDRETTRAGLDAAERAALAAIDAADLDLAAQGFAAKRSHKRRHRWLERVRRYARRLWGRAAAGTSGSRSSIRPRAS